MAKYDTNLKDGNDADKLLNELNVSISFPLAWALMKVSNQGLMPQLTMA